MKVMHLLPAYHSHVHVEVAIGLARDATVCAERGWKHIPVAIDKYGIDIVRNMGVRLAYEQGADLLLMQDADTFAILPAFGALESLHKTMDKFGAAVVGAAVPVRNGQWMNCKPARPGEAYEGEVGSGIMLIDLRRLKDLPRPWFRISVDETGERMSGEDISFCQLVRNAGHRVVVDYTFSTGHGYSSVHASNPNR